MVTRDRLRELFTYSKKTGLFKRRVRRKQSKYGTEHAVGSINDAGYRIISVDGCRYRAHILAWIYVTGSAPRAEIDHRDNNRDNNSWSNLREATRKQNSENVRLPINNTSGHKGVTWWARDGRWKAQIGHRGKCINLGYFDRLEDAVAARRIAELKLFTHGKAVSC